jgi:NAD(P)-dependent dehydrogenase (short-subunit alcohol dehydrogenase family)
MDRLTNSDLKKVALVTGASRRIGREIALLLAKQGWSIAVHHRASLAEADKTVDLCKALDANAVVFQADLSSEAQCRALFNEALVVFGQIDAVINCAALFEPDEGQDVSFQHLEAHFKTNTAAPVLLTSLLYEHRKASRLAQPAACSVNLLDQKLWNPNPDFLSYTLSKAALKEATTLQAQAYAPLVRVVGIAPGLTLSSHMMTEDKFAELHKMAPLGQSSDTDDIAQAVLFVLQSKAITGETILVDGGQHLKRLDRDFSLM